MGWTDVQAIIAWAKAKPEDMRGLAQALGEDEVDAEMLAALPDEMIIEAFSTWVEEKKPGQIAQVKVGMVINGARVKYGADLIDPMPKKKAPAPVG